MYDVGTEYRMDKVREVDVWASQSRSGRAKKHFEDTSADWHDLHVELDARIRQESIDRIMRAAMRSISHWCSDVQPIDGFLPGTNHIFEQISRGGRLKLYDSQAQDEYELNRESFLKGVRMYIKSGGGSWVIDNHRIHLDWLSRDSADAIIQYAVFGEIVYRREWWR
jgi:hypothetical protein